MGRCLCHGTDARWVAGWDDIVTFVGKDDVGWRLWREWLEKVDIEREERRKEKKAYLERKAQEGRLGKKRRRMLGF